MGKKIAIIFHENSKNFIPGMYQIFYIAKNWVKAGHKVFRIYGVKKYIHADIAILHVDLSIVPEEYIEFASRYPVVLNGEITNIKKSYFSTNILSKEDNYKGKVIVKSDLNFAGVPERKLCGLSTQDWLLKFNWPSDYKVYDSLNDIPELYFNDENLVVEKFLPEKKNGLYYCLAFYGYQPFFLCCVNENITSE